MSFDKRKCLYHGEAASKIPALYRPKAFKDYTMVNCLLECDAKIVMNECGCLPYHYPEFKKVRHTETSCNVSGIQCLADNYRKYIEVNFYNAGNLLNITLLNIKIVAAQ